MHAFIDAFIDDFTINHKIAFDIKLNNCFSYVMDFLSPIVFLLICVAFQYALTGLIKPWDFVNCA